MWATVCFSIFVATFLTFSATAEDPAVSLFVDERDLIFVFYSRKRPEGQYIYSRDISELHKIPGLFDPTHHTVVLIHGWKDDYGADSNTFVRQAILGRIDVNIIKVCWSTASFESYAIARNAVANVGKITANFLERVFGEFHYSFDKVTLVGFSLGAHAAGIIGKNLPGKIPAIVGLDPAGPLISANDLSYCLNRADARYVTVIHTNAGVLGMTDAIGHSDFYPNGGRRQPGCGVDLVGGCAHNRAWEFFAESITNNQFIGENCSSYNAYLNNLCTGARGIMGGLKLDRTHGRYYLMTNDKAPYGKGA